MPRAPLRCPPADPPRGAQPILFFLALHNGRSHTPPEGYKPLITAVPCLCAAIFMPAPLLRTAGYGPPNLAVPISSDPLVPSSLRRDQDSFFSPRLRDGEVCPPSFTAHPRKRGSFFIKIYVDNLVLKSSNFWG